MSVEFQKYMEALMLNTIGKLLPFVVSFAAKVLQAQRKY